MGKNKSIKELIEEMMLTGKMPAELLELVNRGALDPAKLDEMLSQLKEMGADQVGSGAPLNIADFYKPGFEKYEQRWELSPNLPLPVPFDDLDRKTQFFVLFQEWSRREFDGLTRLNAGDVDGADDIFDECVDRAKQIDVPELEARSYENKKRAAQRRGDRKGELEWSNRAAAARQVRA